MTDSIHTLADKLANVKEYTNKHLLDAAMNGKLLLSQASPFIIVSAATRDALIAALRAPIQPVEAGEVLDAIANVRKQTSADTVQVAVLRAALDDLEAKLTTASPPSPQETRRALELAKIDLEAALVLIELHAGQSALGLRQTIKIVEAALSTSPAPAEDVWRSPATWRAPIKTVTDLVSNLLTLDQSMEIHGAYHANNQARARGLSLSRERVTNGTIRVGDESVPYSLIIWSGPPAEDVRASVIEECAKVCDDVVGRAEKLMMDSKAARMTLAAVANGAMECAENIRSLTIPDPKQAMQDGGGL